MSPFFVFYKYFKQILLLNNMFLIIFYILNIINQINKNNMFLFTIFRDIHISCNNYMFYDKGNKSHKSTRSKVLSHDVK